MSRITLRRREQKERSGTQRRNKIMVRVSKQLLQKAATELGPLGKTLSEILVCPLSKHPLRYYEQSNSLISDAIGVSLPIKNGIPCLVPKDGKILEEEDASKPDNDIYSK